MESISREQLKILRDRLPHGGIKEVHRRLSSMMESEGQTPIGYDSVVKILHGHYGQMSRYEVLEIANKVATEYERKVKKLAASNVKKFKKSSAA